MKKVLLGLGERLKSLHPATSQKPFSDKCGIKQSSLSCWENETKTPSAAAIEAICRSCGVSADWLLGISPLGGKPSTPPEPQIKPSPAPTGTSPDNSLPNIIDRLIWRNEKLEEENKILSVRLARADAELEAIKKAGQTAPDARYAGKQGA